MIQSKVLAKIDGVSIRLAVGVFAAPVFQLDGEIMGIFYFDLIG